MFIATIINSVAILAALFCIWVLNNGVKDLKDTVDSHWGATQRECNIIWREIKKGGEEDGNC